MPDLILIDGIIPAALAGMITENLTGIIAGAAYCDGALHGALCLVR